MHPQFAEYGTFRHLKLGKLPARRDDRTLALEDYVDLAALPPIPATFDNTGKVPSFPMDGNDMLGDCTLAAVAHMVQAWTYEAGDGYTPPQADVIKAYWETGTPPRSTGEAGGPTDTGRDELSILNWWRKTGLDGHKITAYVSVNPRNEQLVKTAIYLFGGVYTGIELPVTAQGQTVWDVVGDGKTGNSAPGSWGGHAVPYEAYSAAGTTVVTWGGLLKATWRFTDVYIDEMYAIVSNDEFLKSGKTIEGFNAKQLAADLKAVTA